MEESWLKFRPYRWLVKRELVSPQTDSSESSPVALSSIVLAS